MPKHWTLVEYSDGRPPGVFRAEQFGSEDLQNWSCYWYFASGEKGDKGNKEPHMKWVMVRRIQDLPVDFLSLYKLTAPAPFRSSFVLHMNEKGANICLHPLPFAPFPGNGAKRKG
jgi:hypothetical protein